jgi:hypothetical protein
MADTNNMSALKTAAAIDALSAAGVKNAWIEFENGQTVQIGTVKRCLQNSL